MAWPGLTVGQGSVSKSQLVTVALLGLALTTGQGTVTASGGAGSVLLTGSSSTSAAGSLTPSGTPALTGTRIFTFQGPISAKGRSLVAMSQGTITPQNAPTPVGLSSTASAGTVTPTQGGTVGPLVGQVSTCLQGVMSPPNTGVLLGTASTTAAGTLIPGIIPTFDQSGQAIVTGIGILQIAPGPKTVNITGSQMTSAQGVVDPRPILIGQVITSARGSVTPSVTLALVGTAVTVDSGFLAVGQDPDDTKIQSFTGVFGAVHFAPVIVNVALIGTATTGQQGTVSTTPDANFALTGQAVTPATGLMSVTLAATLQGHGLVMVGIQGNLGAPGTASLTGQVITTQQGQVFTTGDRTRALVGSASVFATGLFSTGTAPTLFGLQLASGSGLLGQTGGSKAVALTGQVMTLNTGTLTPSGGDVMQSPATNEGCGIVADVTPETEVVLVDHEPSEGCLVVAGASEETEA